MCVQGLRWEAANGNPSMTTTYLNWMASVYAKYPSESMASCLHASRQSTQPLVTTCVFAVIAINSPRHESDA